MSSHTPDAIPGLLNEIVVTHILGEDSLLTHADLARLRAVSQSMRNAVGETGRFAPFYRPAVQAAQEHKGKPHDWPSVNIGSLCVDLRTDPASALVSVCPPKVNGEPSPRTRTRRAITSEELRAPLVDRYNGHLPTPLRRRTLTFGVVVEVFKPGDSLGSFEMYKDITANGGRVRLQKAFDVEDTMYGTSTQEVWEKTDANDDEWTVGDVVEIMLLRFRKKHPTQARCWGHGGPLGIWEDYVNGEVTHLDLMQHIGCYLMIAHGEK